MRHLQNFEMIRRIERAGSIRKAAADMHITPSALNRQLNQFERELGAQIFERLPRGVRLNAEGELFLQHIRAQLADLARVRSQIDDHRALRRGRVSIACSQALQPYFLPRAIAQFRRRHPQVTFATYVRDRAAAEEDLAKFHSDLALVFEPVYMVDFEILAAIPQRIHAVMRADHPLSEEREIRLAACLDRTYLMPNQAYGVRDLLEQAARRMQRRLSPAIEADSFDLMCHYVLEEEAIAFQIPVGLDPAALPGMVHRPLAEADVPAGSLILGQAKGRSLPVASHAFAKDLAAAMDQLA
ncbi:MAG: LysR family transcriptional regulator [Pseudomonadota bacterium]